MVPMATIPPGQPLLAQELHSPLPGLCPSRSLALVEGGVNAVSLDTCSQPPEASLCCLVSLLLLWVEKTEGDERQKDAFNFWLVLVFLLSSESEYSCYNL